MRDSSAVAITNWGMIEEWRSRPRQAPRLFPFSYAWSHTSTGNNGTGIIHMPSKEALVEWVARWNHSNFANGWFYSVI